MRPVSPESPVSLALPRGRREHWSIYRSSFWALLDLRAATAHWRAEGRDIQRDHRDGIRLVITSYPVEVL